MNDSTATFKCSNVRLAAQQVVNALNIAPLAQIKDTVFRFSGRLMNKEQTILLVELTMTPDDNGKDFLSCLVLEFFPRSLFYFFSSIFLSLSVRVLSRYLGCLFPSCFL
jgi:hypothetical protein